MNPATTVRKVNLWLSWIVAAILLLLPFHALLTVWLSSHFGHYTLLRLWKELLLVAVTSGAAYLLATDKKLFKKLISLKLTRLILAYIVLILLMSFIPLAAHTVSAKAMWYGLLVDLRFLVFFLAVMIIAAKSTLLGRIWDRLLFAPAVLVAAFAVLQYLVLPYDFLRHFGYSDSTIPPYETINHNINHLRVLSTLRGANPLGAYLILPISALAVMFFRERVQTLNKTLIGWGFLAALIFSFSRSAWLGAILSVLIVAWLSLKSERARRVMLFSAGGVLVVGLLLALVLRDNTSFEDVFLHTNHKSTISTNSNENHASAARAAANDVLHQPLGSGVGSAGPQSVYNKDLNRISENYYLQIGQEAGVLGILLFIAICIVIAVMLFARRADPMALALFASLMGISLVNLLSHAWTDDTLAYVWWGLAGVALAPILAGRQKTNGKNHKS